MRVEGAESRKGRNVSASYGGMISIFALLSCSA
jgi:hypothetical protein